MGENSAKKIEALRHILAQIGSADEAARQVILAVDPGTTTEMRDVRQYAGKCRELMREAEKIMVVMIYDEERRGRRMQEASHDR